MDELSKLPGLHIDKNMEAMGDGKPGWYVRRDEVENFIKESRKSILEEVKEKIGRPFEDSEMVDSVSFPSGDIHTADWKRGVIWRTEKVLKKLEQLQQLGE